MRLVRGRRVLERVRRVDVEHAAAVDAELLDGDLTGRLEQAQGLLTAFQSSRCGVGRQGLRQAEHDQHDRQHKGQGQQDVESRPGQVGPEVSDAFPPIGDERPRQRRGDGRPGGGGDEILDGQSGHLGEGRHGGLTAIGLPVGVGHEADGGIERQMRRQALEALRVQRQPALQTQHGVEQQEARQIERQQRPGIAEPALAAGRINARCAIEDGLDRLQHRIQPGPLAIPDARHIEPDRPAQQAGQTEGQGDFRPALKGHVRGSLRTARGARAPRSCTRRRQPRRRPRGWRRSSSHPLHCSGESGEEHKCPAAQRQKDQIGHCRRLRLVETEQGSRTA